MRLYNINVLRGDVTLGGKSDRQDPSEIVVKSEHISPGLHITIRLYNSLFLAMERSNSGLLYFEDLAVKSNFLHFPSSLPRLRGILRYLLAACTWFGAAV